MKDTKKIVTVLLAGSFLAAPPAFATAVPMTSTQATPSSVVKQTAIPKNIQESLQKLYMLVPELRDLKLKEIDTYEMKQASFYALNYEGANEKANATVVFHLDTGELYRFSITQPDWASKNAPSVSLVKEKTAEFLKNMMGEKVATHYQMNDGVGFMSSGGMEDGKEVVFTEASAQFQPLVHGIPLQSGQHIAMNVNAAGRVTSFTNMNEEIDTSVFPDPKRAISKAEAEKTFLSALKMELMYDEKQPTVVKLLGEKTGEHPVVKYIPRNVPSLDAITGKLRTSDIPQEKWSVQNYPVTPKGQRLTVKNAQEAAELLKNQFGIEVSGLSIVENEYDNPFTRSSMQSYTWNRQNDQSEEYYVQTDTKTGHVLQAGVHKQGEVDRTKRVNKPITKEEAGEIAVKALEKYLPVTVKEIQVREVSSMDEEEVPSWVDKSKLDKVTTDMINTYYIWIAEVHNGIPVGSRTYNVQVDYTTGQVKNMSFNPERKMSDLPDAANIITKEVAATEYLRTHPLQLQYIWLQYGDQKAPAPQLVYELSYGNSHSYIDAISGKTVEVPIE